MSFSCFLKLAIGAEVLSALGFFAIPYLGLEGQEPIPSIFATGCFLHSLHILIHDFTMTVSSGKAFVSFF